jgi:hypothetical protein
MYRGYCYLVIEELPNQGGFITLYEQKLLLNLMDTQNL